MGTPYSIIIERFIKKLRGDTRFLNYAGLSELEISELANDHGKDLINQAIGMIYEHGNPDVNFYDKDDILEQFNFDMVNQEIDLIINIMYQKYFDEDKNKLRVFGLTFNSKELNVISPANERKTFLDMLSTIEKDNVGSIENYFSRDRLTWKLRSVYKK